MLSHFFINSDDTVRIRRQFSNTGVQYKTKSTIMKTTKIIKDKKEVKKKLLTTMYKSVCAEKELLEMLLEAYRQGIIPEAE